MAKRDEDYGFSDFIDFIAHPYGPPESYEDTWLTRIIDRAEISDPYANEPSDYEEVSAEEMAYLLEHGLLVELPPEPGEAPETRRYMHVDDLDKEW